MTPEQAAAIAKQMNAASEAIYQEILKKWGVAAADLISELANVMILTKWAFLKMRSRAFADEAARSCAIMLDATIEVTGTPRLEVEAAIQRFLAAREFNATTTPMHKGES
jgi:hypothetical protein